MYVDDDVDVDDVDVDDVDDVDVVDVDDVDDVDVVDVVDDDADDDVDEMREKKRHPFAQTNDTGNLTKHWPCAVKTHFPGQHIRPGRIIIFEHVVLTSSLCCFWCIQHLNFRGRFPLRPAPSSS